MYNLCTLFMWFVTYCFIGWLYESIVLSIEHKKIINTGFLTLPLCPIYGFGALICLWFLRSQEQASMYLIFIGCGSVCCVFEYFVSWFLEKTLKARWWDYSNYKFNINGRVCLWGFLAFGLLCTVLLKHLHPFIRNTVLKMSDTALYITSAIIFIAIMVDLVATLKTLIEFKAKLSAIQKVIDLEKEKSKQKIDGLKLALQEKAIDLKDRFSDYSVEIKTKTSVLYNIRFTGKVKEFIENRKFNEKRLLRAFPTLKSLNNKDALEKIRSHIKRKK